jgi:hypothetical protein
MFNNEVLHMIKYLLPSFSRDLNMPLTTNRALIIRLLHLFPVKFLKEHFNETGGRDEVIEIISNAPSNSIASFVQSYHDVTKHLRSLAGRSKGI